MKISSSILSLCFVGYYDASAFSTPTPTAVAVGTPSSISSIAPAFDREEKTSAIDIVLYNTKDRIEPGRYNERPNSIAIPFLKRPPLLDGSHAGDCGFDPLGFTESQDLYIMQEAELRHARLAMCAVVGWPMSELWAPKWMLQENGCAPSVLNGFNPLSFIATVLLFGGIGYAEYKTSLRRVNHTPIGKKHAEDMADVWEFGVAGDYNFDPLGLYSSLGDTAAGRKALREVEIAHGRSAMLGITAFAFWEFLTRHPIVENSMFFHPNLLLPALVGTYFATTQIFEFEESDTFIALKVSSEGGARLENARRSLADAKESNQVYFDAASLAAEKAIPLLASAWVLAKETYDKINEEYTESIMENILAEDNENKE